MNGSLPVNGAPNGSSHRPVLSAVRDLCAGFILFMVFCVVLTADSPAALLDANSMLALKPASAEKTIALVSVAVAFSAFFAFNIGLWRHLRQTAKSARQARSQAMQHH